MVRVIRAGVVIFWGFSACSWLSIGGILCWYVWARSVSREFMLLGMLILASKFGFIFIE
jgi:hypothetical protein